MSLNRMESPLTKRHKPLSSEFLLHVMIWIPLIFIIIFHYYPMISGFSIAFKDYKPGLGIAGSPWVGFKHIQRMFMTADALRAIRNTLIIAAGKIVFNLVIPLLVALMLNEVRIKWYKRAVQTISYLPYFISWVVLSGVFTAILSPEGGLVNNWLGNLGIGPISFLGNKDVFRQTMVITDVWKNFGYNSIVYLAALTAVDPVLYEAAVMDGAGRWRQTLHVTLPGIATFIALMTILSVGNVLNAGFDQIFNLYNVAVYETGDIIDTLVYRLGMQQQRYSFSTAVGLFKSVVSLILIVSSNYLAKTYAGYRVF